MRLRRSRKCRSTTAGKPVLILFTSWPGLSRPSRFYERDACRIGITGTRPVMT
jgi:hypothetical protein